MEKPHTKKRIFICGPSIETEDGNEKAFSDMETKLRDAGFEPINPCIKNRIVTTNYDESIAEVLKKRLRRIAFAKADIKELLDADGIILLDGWNNCKNAKMQVAIARELDIFELAISKGGQHVCS